MIIECPACRSRFRLDETKIRGRGARVRCRRCGESIVVLKPEEKPPPPPAEATPGSLDLAAALRDAAGRPPEAAIPPPPAPPIVAAPESEREPEPAPVPEPAVPAWAFRTEEPAEPAAPAATPVSESAPGPDAAPDEVDLAFDRLLAQAAGEEPYAADREPTEEERPPADEAPAPEFPPAAPVTGTEGAAGEIADVAESPEPPGAALRFAPEERLTMLSAEPVAAPAGEPPSYEIVQGFDEPLRSESPPGAEPAAPQAKPVGFELTEEAPLFEEKRDLYDISATVQERPAVGPDEDRAPSLPPAEARTRAEDIQDELMAIRGRSPVSAEEEPVARPPEPLARPPLPAPAEARGAAAAAAGRPFVKGLIALFLVLAAGGAWLGFTPGGQETLRALLTRTESLLPGKQKGPQSAYNFTNVIGYYESGAQAGRLFVIKGQVTNASRARKHSIQVVAALLDSKGQPMAQQTVYAGSLLTGDFLRQATREKIEAELSNPIGRNLQNIDITPGRTVPFTAVFFGAPDGIDAYRLEAKDGE